MKTGKVKGEIVQELHSYNDNSILIEELDNKPPDLSAIKQGEDVYFEVLELQPIILSVSFVRNTSQSDDHSHT